MADSNKNRSLSRINKKINNLNATVNDLYQKTYSTRPEDKDTVASITNGIEDSLDDILSKINGQEISDISTLYLRISEKNNSSTYKDISNSLEELFDGNKQIIDTINLDNIRKSIQAENYQYDLICKYMPKLEDAIEIKKDNVLSSDNFTKDFINVVSNKNNKNGIDLFSDRANIIKEKYKLQDLFEELYYDASKYGESFLYHVPYSKAFKKLLDRKNRLDLGIKYESVIATNGSEVIFESATGVKSKEIADKFDKEYLKEISENDMQVKVLFDDSYIIPEAVENLVNAKKAKSKHISLSEDAQFTNEGVLKYEDNGLSSDGLTIKDTSTKVSSDINGCILFKIPREDIIPIYMGTLNIGYLHITSRNDYLANMAMNGHTYNSLATNSSLIADEVEKQNDLMISQISAMLAEKIDAKFINSNTDLKEQIYAVLRHNDNFNSTRGTNTITVQFIPSEDIHHFYFKMDPKTHRGISDLSKAAIPAMIYCLLYLNTVIGQIGRSQDKRVYYVKQNVEQNVAKTLLNVITQIKKGNMGMRQLENMNTIFNVIGKYNDHIIPMSQSGESPIQMEVMQGQDVQTPSELLERMEEMAVSSTDVPLEFIQSVNNVDYSARFTMSNSKFLRKVYKRQRICQDHFTLIFRKCYNYEYDENDTTSKIMLPAPSFLAMSNTQQLIDNTKNYANAIADIICVGVNEQYRDEFIKLFMMNQLGTYLNLPQIEELLTVAKLNMSVNNNDDMDANTSSY